jgi:hypothetical protein
MFATLIATHHQDGYGPEWGFPRFLVFYRQRLDVLEEKK